MLQSSLYECGLKEVYWAGKMLIEEQTLNTKITVRYTQTLGLITIITNMITFTK